MFLYLTTIWYILGVISDAWQNDIIKSLLFNPETSHRTVGPQWTNLRETRTLRHHDNEHRQQKFTGNAIIQYNSSINGFYQRLGSKLKVTKQTKISHRSPPDVCVGLKCPPVVQVSALLDGSNALSQAKSRWVQSYYPLLSSFSPGHTLSYHWIPQLMNLAAGTLHWQVTRDLFTPFKLGTDMLQQQSTLIKWLLND